jgi:FkbM family methyltransferase
MKSTGHQVFSKHDLKVLLRSRSVRFTRDRRAKAFHPGTSSTISWRGHTVHYRPGSSDPEVIYKILLKGGSKAEYHVPEGPRPRVVWDIGANIGAAALYFAERFPDAEIHCFEPLPENHALMEKNLSGSARLKAHCLALGAGNSELEIHASDNPRNFGGFSFHYSGTQEVPVHTVRVLTPAAVIAEGLAPAPDFIKIDVEGAEYDILTAFEPEVLAKVAWITGELHSKRSFALLEHLSQRFDIEVRKQLGKPLFNFNARKLN